MFKSFIFNTFLLLNAINAAFLTPSKIERKFLYLVKYSHADKVFKNLFENDGIRFYEEKWILVAENISLHGFWVPAQNDTNVISAEKTVIPFLGNTCIIEDMLPFVSFFAKTLKANVFLFSYRGYGLSEGDGSTCESNIRNDSIAIFRWVAQTSNLPIILHGYSLGSAVAIALLTDLAELAVNEEKCDSLYKTLWSQIGAVILECPILSIPKYLKQTSWFLRLFRWFCNDKWDSESRLCRLIELRNENDNIIHSEKLLIFFMCAENDNQSPLENTETLFGIVTKKFQKNKVALFKNADHLSIKTHGQYYETLKEYFNKVI